MAAPLPPLGPEAGHREEQPIVTPLDQGAPQPAPLPLGEVETGKPVPPLNPDPFEVPKADMAGVPSLEVPPVSEGTAVDINAVIKTLHEWGMALKKTPKKPSEAAKGVKGQLSLSEDYLKALMEVETPFVGVGEAQAIKWWRVGPDEVDSLLMKVTSMVKKNVQSDELTRQLARDLQLSLEDVTQLMTRGDLAPQMLATNTLLASAAKAAIKMKREIDQVEAVGKPSLGADPLKIEYGKMLAKLMFLADKRTQLAGEIGNALRVNQLPIEGMATGKALAEKLKMAGVTPEALMAGDAQAADVAYRLTQPFTHVNQIETFVKLYRAYPNAFIEAWIAGLVSGPQTHAANIVGNSLALVNMVIEKQIAGFSGLIRAGVAKAVGKDTPVDRVYMGEGLQAVMGGIEGFRDLLKAGVKSNFGAKIDMKAPAISAQALGIGDNILGQATDALGRIIRLPLNALAIEDAVFIGVAHGAELRTLAYNLGMQRGLHGDELIDFMGKVMREPKTFASVHDQAKALAAYHTFNQELGALGTGVQNFLNLNPLFRMLIPFLRTPTNLIKYSAERTPLLNAQHLYKGLTDWHTAAGDVSRAKVAMSGMIAATIVPMLYTGQLTGPGAFDPELRRMEKEAGFVPFAYFNGESYTALDRTDPLGMTLYAVASAAWIAAHGDQVTAEQAAAQATSLISMFVTDRTYLRSISNFVEAATAINQGRYKQAMTQFWGNYAATMVPFSGATHQLARAMDSQFKDYQHWTDYVVGQMPGYSKNVPPKRDLYGRPLVWEHFGYGVDFINPFKRIESRLNEPGLREIARLQMVIDPLPRTLAGPQESANPDMRSASLPGITLDAKQYDALQKELRTVQLGGKTLKEQLDDWVESPGYQSLSEGDMRDSIHTWVAQYRLIAQWNYLGKNPDLMEKYLEMLTQQQYHKHVPGVEPSRALPKGY